VARPNFIAGDLINNKENFYQEDPQLNYYDTTNLYSECIRQNIPVEVCVLVLPTEHIFVDFFLWLPLNRSIMNLMVASVDVQFQKFGH